MFLMKNIKNKYMNSFQKGVIQGAVAGIICGATILYALLRLPLIFDYFNLI